MSPLVFSLVPRSHGELGASEVDRHVSGEGEGGMLGHLGALIPGQRPAQARGQPVHRVEQGVLHR